MDASWCAYKRDITVNSVRQHNLSNKALFQNNNISNKALFQITMSQTRRYSKQQCLKQGVIPKQQCLKQGVIPKYAQIKVPYTSLASIITQKKMQISRIWEEIKFLYKKCLNITSNWLNLPKKK
jgi:hypothetical protein